MKPYIGQRYIEIKSRYSIIDEIIKSTPSSIVVVISGITSNTDRGFLVGSIDTYPMNKFLKNHRILFGQEKEK